MGNFNRVKRVQTGPEDWIDLRPLTVAESREFDEKARDVEDMEEAANLRLDLALSHIVAWSDDCEVSIEQARELDIAVVWTLFQRLTGMEADLPLPDGSASTATSEE